MDELRLTRLVKGGGCARKLPAQELVEVLRALPTMAHPWLSAETGPMDDAAVVYPSETGPGLVLTVDVITPIVDDPRDFGRIAAANAIRLAKPSLSHRSSNQRIVTRSPNH